MRLQLKSLLCVSGCLALCGAVPPPEPDADGVRRDAARTAEVLGDAELRESLYLDTDSTAVSTTSLDATIGPRKRPVVFRGGYTLDAVTSASVDVLSMASTAWREQRHQGAGGVRVSPGLWSVDTGYVFSTETDWTSHAGSVSVGRDLNARNTNLTVGQGVVYNAIADATDATFSDEKITSATTVALSQVLGRRTIGRIVGFYGHASGLQSSVYRAIPVGRDPTSQCREGDGCTPEVHPRKRNRFAIAAAVAQFIPTKHPSALHAHYRYYADGWGVDSHTVELQLRAGLSEHWQLRLQSRTYLQSAASFYKARYDQIEPFMTVDRELSPFLHQLSGLRLSYATGTRRRLEDLRFDLKADVSNFHFFDFPRLPLRLALVVEAGLRLRF